MPYSFLIKQKNPNVEENQFTKTKDNLLLAWTLHIQCQSKQPNAPKQDHNSTYWMLPRQTDSRSNGHHKSTTRGFPTDLRKFSIRSPAGRSDSVISFVGYKHPKKVEMWKPKKTDITGKP